jgi:hypothetical protein
LRYYYFSAYGGQECGLGSVILNVVPPAGLDSTETEPSWSSIILLTKRRPSPEPECREGDFSLALVVKNG